MGTFDISRTNFDAKKHYSSVRMQQGRVLTDDDWNENERIENEGKRKSNIDIIGAFGTPDNGFQIDNLRLDAGLINFDMKPGTLYLGGLRLELDGPETYRLQKDWLQQPALLDRTLAFTGRERYDLVYLEAWQQAVSAVEDSSLFEVALGGPDTTTRVRNMRRIHLAAGTGFYYCEDAWNKLVLDWKNTRLGNINDENERITDTRLKVSFSNSGLPDDLCTPSAAGGYLGAENQTIRVQLVDRDHFTWGFDNASPLYRVAVSADRKTVRMLTEPKDQYHWPLSNQVVEILPWSAVLSNGEKIAEQMGHLTKVYSSYDPDTGEFTIRDTITNTFGADWKNRSDKIDLADQPTNEYFFLRVWNRGDDLGSDPNIPITLGLPVKLGHTGLEITITGNDRIANDYWVFSARPETPSSVVPWELEQGIPPNGVRRFFAPLAVIRWTKVNNLISGEIIHDCRVEFDPLTKKPGACVTVSPVPGWERIFNRFKPGQDICICFKNGIYELNRTVILKNKGNIKFTGCGKGSQIIVKNNEAAFAITSCKDILIRDLSIENSIGNNIRQKHLNGVVTMNGCRNILFENVTISCINPNNIVIRQNTCISINTNMPLGNAALNLTSSATIRSCQFIVGHMQTGLLIINTVKSIIEGNTINSTGMIGNQGIVLAGISLQNIHVKDNVINGVLQGIHIGASNNKSKNRSIKKAVCTLISGNSIVCLLNKMDKKERHGIFVGNCDSLVIRDNIVSVTRINNNEKRWPPSNGIRLYGHYGKRIIIKDNHLVGYDFVTNRSKVPNPNQNQFIPNYGIFIHHLNSPKGSWQWIVETNVAEKILIEAQGLRKYFKTSEMKFLP